MLEQSPRCDRDFGDRGVERYLVGFGRFGKAAYLTNELKRGGGDFFIGGRRPGTAEDFDAATHYGAIVAR